MATDPTSTPVPTPAALGADEGFLHSVATSMGIDPDALKTAVRVIGTDPVGAAKAVGSEAVDELNEMVHNPVQTATTTGQGMLAAVTNPDAKATAMRHLKSPGLNQKIQGLNEYAASIIPFVGGNIVKSQEQAAQGNLAGSLGTVVGTTLPMVTDSEPVQAVKSHLAETGAQFIQGAKESLQRAATATAPEGSLEAGFAKIGGKKVKDGAPKPNYAYRARPVGQEGIGTESHAQATASSEEAQRYASDLENSTGQPHEVVKVDLNKVPAENYTRKAGPNGNDWVKFHEPVDESIVEKSGLKPDFSALGSKTVKDAEPSLPEKIGPIRAYHGTAATTPFTEFSTEGRPVNTETGEPLTSGSGADPTSYLGAHFAAEPETANKFAMRSTPWMKSRFEMGEGEEGAAGPRVMPVDLNFKKTMDFGPESRMRDAIYSGDLNHAGYAGEHLLNRMMEADGIEAPDEDGPEVEQWLKKYDSDLDFRRQQNRWLFETYSPQEEEDELLHEGASELATQTRHQLLQAGYDSAFYKNEIEGGKSYIAFHPSTIQSPFKAEMLKVVHGGPDEFAAAVQNTAGARLNGKTLTVRAERYQKPEQAGEPSVRTGVFYSPEPNSPYSKYYKTGKIGYGGKQRIEGDITFQNPIIAKGASGGKVPERVYDSIKGKGAYNQMRRDVLNAVIYTQDYRQKLPEKFEQNIANVLEKYGADPDNAGYIIEHSKTGNTLPYAIQENIIAHAVRAAGHDGIVGYNKIKGQHRLSEVFHITQDTYPEGK